MYLQLRDARKTAAEIVTLLEGAGEVVVHRTAPYGTWVFESGPSDSVGPSYLPQNNIFSVELRDNDLGERVRDAVGIIRQVIDNFEPVYEGLSGSWEQVVTGPVAREIHLKIETALAQAKRR